MREWRKKEHGDEYWWKTQLQDEGWEIQVTIHQKFAKDERIADEILSQVMRLIPAIPHTTPESRFITIPIRLLYFSVMLEFQHLGSETANLGIYHFFGE